MLASSSRTVKAVPISEAPSLAALLFDPFPLYLAQRNDPSLVRTPLVCVEEQRILHATPQARRRGVTLGMRLTGARMRVEGLRVVELDEPSVQHAWHELLREIHGVTPWLEATRRGRVFARLSPSEAARLAEDYGARVGVADSREIAELAAISARPGEHRRVTPGDEAEFLERLPLRFLKGVGVSDKNLTRLHWLGLKTAGDLARWNDSQLRSYLADEGEALLPYLHGPYSTQLRPYALPVTLRRSVSFEELAREPFELLPALERLSTSLEHGLDGRAARRLTLTAGLVGGQRRVTRLSKRPLTRAPQIRQQALFALDDSGAAPLGIERLTLELAEPERLGLQGGLWRTRERREEALDAALARFPGALVRFAWRDPYAQADDLAWAWETIPGPDDAPTPRSRAALMPAAAVGAPENRAAKKRAAKNGAAKDQAADSDAIRTLAADRRSIVQASAVPLFDEAPSAVITEVRILEAPTPVLLPTPPLPTSEGSHAPADAPRTGHPTGPRARHRELATPLP